MEDQTCQYIWTDWSEPDTIAQDTFLNQKVYHNLYNTIIWIQSKKDMLAKQPCCIQTNMYTLNRKMTINDPLST